MISFEKKFILITPEKTGSVSLVTALRKYIDFSKVTEQRKDCFDFGDSFGTKYAKHLPLSRYEKLWDDQVYGSLDEYHLCVSIRNPFDREVSWWKWTRRKASQDPKDFKQFVLNFKTTPLLDKIESKKYKIKNFIRFENIEKDFKAFCVKVGIDEELPHRNKSSHMHYTKYYDDETRQIVAEKYAKDIEYFNYEY